VAGQGEGKPRTQEPGIAALAEQGCTQAHRCNPIAVCVGNSLDQTVETEPPQLISNGG
jgi:hypothetical protein